MPDYIEDILEDVKEAKKQGFSERELEDYLTNKYGSDSARKVLRPDVKRVELVGAEIVTIKGEPGDKPTKEELLRLIKPLIPKVKDGKTPVKGKDYFTDKEIKSIQNEVKPKLGVDYFTPQEVEQFKNEVTPQKGVDYRDGVDAEIDYDKVLKEFDYNRVIDEVLSMIPTPKNGENGVPPKHEWNGLSLRFQNPDGTWGQWVNLQTTIKMNSPRGGGGLSASGIYTETPVGAINGSNVTYTVTNEIHNVIGFCINSQYIHPAEYSTSGKTITFVTALPADLSGTSFSITYV